VTGRPLHALLLPPAASVGRLTEALAAALDGSGPAILPLDPGLSRPRLAALLDTLAPAAVETPDGIERLAGATRPAAADPGTGAGVPEDVAVVIATSGSTGQPKGVQLSAAALLHSARASLDRIGARPGDRWLCPLPTSHIAGLGILVRSLAAGSEPVVTERLGPANADFAGYGCAYTSLVPTQLRRLLAAGVDLTPLRTVLLGGAAIPAGLLASARAAGARVVTTYGMSETCGGCVYDGMPLAGVAVRAGSTGRIEISGPVVFSGYRSDPALTAEVMNGEWFVTSDIGELDGTGKLTVHGRADDMINTGGEKVAPAEVAAVLETCPAVREAAVIGEPDPDWGERVTAVVVPADPQAPPTLDGLRAHARGQLPPYAAPRALILVPQLPLLPSGKPDRAALRTLRCR
jgi:o-succinylbenzoate---CoA ligase